MSRPKRMGSRPRRGKRDVISSAKDYQLVVYWSDEDRAYLAEAPELPGCVTHGRTEAEALKKGRDAIVSWLEAAEEFEAPVPTPTRDFTGQFVVRIGKTLHRDLVKKAEVDHLSLNQLVQSILRRAV
jgi:predicted RNase H-like HicB family nuclease